MTPNLQIKLLYRIVFFQIFGGFSRVGDINSIAGRRSQTGLTSVHAEAQNMMEQYTVARSSSRTTSSLLSDRF